VGLSVICLNGYVQTMDTGLNNSHARGSEFPIKGTKYMLHVVVSYLFIYILFLMQTEPLIIVFV